VPDHVMQTSFSHHSATFAHDPVGISDELRTRSPVAWSTEHGGFWVVSSYQLITQVFQNYETFTSRHGAAVPDLSFGTTHIPVTLDPPEHHVFRRYLNPWFELESVSKREPEMRVILRGVLEELAARGEWDFVADLAEVMPGTMVLGMPVERRTTFLRAMERGMRNQGTTDPVLLEQMDRDNAWIQNEMRSQIADRRATPKDDLISYLAHEPVAGEYLTDQQILDVVMVLLLAGFHTTSGALAAMLVHLERYPGQRAELQANPARIPAAIEEIVRVYAGATSMARTVTRDVEFGGVQMAAGDKVLGLIFAADRDPGKFTDAATVDFDRKEKGSVAFGWGVHRCLGIHIARLILRLELEMLFEVIPDYRIDLERTELADTLGIGYVHKRVTGYLPR
jgi:cytochrome P450